MLKSCVLPSVWPMHFSKNGGNARVEAVKQGNSDYSHGFALSNWAGFQKWNSSQMPPIKL